MEPVHVLYAIVNLALGLWDNVFMIRFLEEIH